MTDLRVPPEAPQPASLYDAGWRQGTIFTIPSAYFPALGLPSTGQDPTMKRRRGLKGEDRLVLTSQDCDLVSVDEDCVEAILCRTKNKAKDRAHLAKVGRNSARAFVIDQDLGLVADPRYRVMIEKSLVQSAGRILNSMSNETRAEFATWLAWRYDRPPVPTEVYEVLYRPIQHEMDRLEREDPATLMAFERGVRSMRVRLPTRSEPPMDLRLLLVLKETRLTVTEGKAIESTVRAIRQGVMETGIPCVLEVDQVPADELLHEVVLATQKVNLDYITRLGVEALAPEQRQTA